MKTHFVLTAFFSIISQCAAQCFCPNSEWLFNSTDSVKIPTEATRTIPKLREGINYRLPTALRPIHYNLVFQVFLPEHNNLRFDGNVSIWFQCEETTNQIIMHLHHLQLKTITNLITSNGDLGPNITKIQTDVLREFLILDLSDNLIPGTIYVVTMSFTGELGTYLPNSGFLYTTYKLNNNLRYVAYTHFEPTKARSAYPCFDEPHMKATFNITVIRHVNMTALSNMPLLYSEHKDDNWIADHFERTPKMSTYLTAVAISEFVSVDVAQIENTQVRIWVRPKMKEYTKTVVSVLPPIIKFMEEYTNISYALPKLDIIGIPRSSMGMSAMEHWGLISSAENALVTVNDTREARELAISVLAHEIAHQWFGNLVTMHWWNELWLKEGISTYIAAEIFAAISEEDNEATTLNYCLQFFDTLETEYIFTSHALSVEHLSAKDIKHTIFSRISYFKGAMIIYMMEKLGGKEALKNGLQRFIKANMYGSATRNDLWDHMNQELDSSGTENINVTEIMDPWVLQQGLPIVTITRNYTSDTAYVRQRIFQPKISQVNFDKDSKWPIPLMFTTKAMNNFNVELNRWMHHEDIVQLTSADGIPTRDEWVLFNPSLHGYYLVNYDNRNWKLLINQLVTNHTALPSKIRVHLVQLLQLLRKNDLIPHQIEFYMLEYLRNEREDHILREGIKTIFNLLPIFKSTQHYYLFRKYLLYVITPIWNHVKSVKVTLKNSDQYIRDIYQLACIAGVKECLDEITNKIYAIISRKTESSIRDLNEDLLCAVMKSLPPLKWEELFLLKNSSLIKYFHFGIFSCTENPYLLYKTLTTIIDKKSERLRTFFENKEIEFTATIRHHFFSRQLAMKIFKENMDEILNWNVEGIIEQFLNTATTQQEFDEIKSIISCLPQSHITGKENSYRRLIAKEEKEFEIRKNTISLYYNWLKQSTENMMFDEDKNLKTV